MGFSRQEYWSGLSFPSPGDLYNPGIKPASPTLSDGFFTTEPQGKPGESYLEIIDARGGATMRQKLWICPQGTDNPGKGAEV